MLPPTVWVKTACVNAQGGNSGSTTAPPRTAAQGGYSGSTAPPRTTGRAATVLLHRRTAQGGNVGFNYCTATNCTAQGGNYGFYYCTATNCTAQGYTGFSHCIATNCTVQGGYYGFYGTTSNKCVVYDCTAASCVTNATSASTLGGDASVTEGAVAVGRIGQMPYMPLGVRQKGTTAIVDTLNSVRTGTALALIQNVSSRSRQ